MEKKFNVVQYVKNVTRSVGYVSTKTVANLNPVISDYADSNMDTIKEMYEAASKINFKDIFSKERMANNEYAKIARDTVSNFFDDLKTGNFYNSGRVNSTEDAASVEMFGEVNFDDLDFGDFDDLDSDDDTEDDGMNIDNIDKVGQKIATSTAASVMKSADYTVKANHASMKMLMAHNEKIMGGINNSIVGVGSTVASIGKTMIESSAKFYENSFTFYNMMTEQMAKQTGYLENMNKMFEDRYNPKKAKDVKNPYKDILDINNLPNLKDYFKHIKSNMSEATMGMSDLFMMAKDSSGEDGGVAMLRAMLSSPISSLMLMGSNYLGKQWFGDPEKGTGSLGRMDKMLKGLFPTALAKMNKMNDDGIQGFLKRLLNLEPSTKRSVNTAKYEKGPQQWNGKDSKALQEVIPTILNRILSALTNEPPSVYDYNKGKWIGANNLRKEFHKELRNSVRYNIDSDLSKTLNEYLDDDLSKINMSEDRRKKTVNSFNEDFVNLMHYLSMNSSRIPLNDKEWKELENNMKSLGLFIMKSNSKGIMLYNNFIKIKRYFSNIRNDKGKGGQNVNLSSFVGNIYSAGNELGSLYEKVEENGNVYNYLFDESKLDELKPMKANLLTLSVDDRGKDIFYYLREISENTRTFNPKSSRVSETRGNVIHNDYSQLKQNIQARLDKRKKSKEVIDQTKIDPITGLPIQTIYDHMSDMYIYDHDTDYDYHTTNKKKKEEASKARENKMKEALDDVIEKIPLTQRFKSLGDATFQALSKPIESINKMIDKATDNIYYLFFGDEKAEGDTISERIKKGFDKTFKKITDTLKEKLSPIGRGIRDGILNALGFKNTEELKMSARDKIYNIKNTLKNAGGWVLDAATMPFKALGEMFNNNFNAAKGGQVKKTGMIAVSEGEIIIPSEYNPNYKKKTDKSKQIADERKALSNWINGGGNTADYMGSYAKGGIVGARGKEILKGNRAAKTPLEEAFYNIKPWQIELMYNYNMISDKELKIAYQFLNMDENKIYNPPEGYQDNGNDKKRLRKLSSTVKAFAKIHKKINVTSKIAKIFDGKKTFNPSTSRKINLKDRTDFMELSGQDNLIYRSTRENIAETKRILIDGTKNIVSRLFGSTGDDKLDLQNTEKLVKASKKELSQAYPQMIVGGGIGALAFGAAGLVGGPLMGAAVGAAIGLTKKSDKIQQMLFGGMVEDEEGNETYKPGMIPPQVVDYLGRNLPSLSKGGFLGAVAGSAGLLGPFGLVGGLAIGAGVTAATKSERLQNYLFGEEGILGKDTDKKIKMSLPKVGLGALAMAATGPFGLAGNLLLGSALGFATETDGFKRFFFGTEDSNGNMQGGLLGLIREEIIDPLKVTMDKIFGGAGDYIKKYIADPLEKFTRPLTNFLGGLLRKPFDWADALKNVMSEKIGGFFSNMFSRIGERTTRTILRGGRKILGGIGQGLATLGKGPGMLLGAAGTALTKHNIKAGRNSGMSAEQMAQFFAENPDFIANNRNNENVMFNKNFSEKLSEMSTEDAESNLSDLRNYRSLRENSAQAKKAIKQEVFDRFLADSTWRTNLIFTGDARVKTALDKAKKTGNFSGVINTLIKLQKSSKNPIPMEQFTKLINFVKAKSEEYNNIDDPEYAEQMRKKAEAAAKNLGMKVSDFDDRRKRQNIESTMDLRRIDEKKGEMVGIDGKPVQKLPDDATMFEKLSIEQGNESVKHLSKMEEYLALLAGIGPTMEERDKEGLKIKEEYEAVIEDKKNAEKRKEELEKISKEAPIMRDYDKDKETMEEKLLRQQEEREEERARKVKEYGDKLSSLNSVVAKEEDTLESIVNDAKYTLKRFSPDPKAVAAYKAEEQAKLLETRKIQERIKDVDSIFKDEVRRAAEGGIVSKEGLVALSEGEVVIPGAGGNTMDGIGQTKVDFTDYGPIEYIKTKSGWEQNIRDSATKKTIAALQLNQDNLTGIKNALGSFGKFGDWIGGLFGGKKDGEDGVGGTKEKGIISTLLEKIGLGDLGTMGLMGAGAALLRKLLPKLKLPGAKTLGLGAGAAGVNEVIEQAVPEEHREAPEDTNIFKKGIEAFENYILGIEPGTYGEDDYRQDSFADNTEEAIMKTFATGRKIKPIKAKRLITKIATSPWNFAADLSDKAGKVRDFVLDPKKQDDMIEAASLAVDNNFFVKMVEKLGKNPGKTSNIVMDKMLSVGGKINTVTTAAEASLKAGKETAESLIKSYASKIKIVVKDGFERFIKWAFKEGGDKILKILGSMADNLIAQLIKGAAKATTKAVGKILAAIFSAGIINGIFILLAAQNGWEDAKANLGVLDEPSIVERLISALISGLNEVALGIIPVEWIFALAMEFASVLGETLKLDLGPINTLIKRREEAQATVDAYNAEHGTTYTVREYIKNVLGEYTTQEKIGNFVKPVWDTGVNNVKNAASTVFDIGKNGFNTAVGAVSSIAKGDFAGAAKTVASYGINNAKIIADGVLNHQFLPGMSASIIGDKIAETDAWKGMTDALDKVFKDGSGLFDEGIGGALEKLTAGAGLVFEGVGATASEMLAGATKSAADWLSKATGGAADPFIQGADDLIKGAKETADDIWKGIKGLFGGSSGVHTSQLDADYMNQKMGNGKVGRNGCGPAVASSVLKRYGKNGSLGSALAFANKGYTGGSSGTSANYFGDIFSANGINTRYTNNTSNINKSLKNGQPTVLLGQNRNNKSKRNSPFGPNPHYVVAQGMDRRGNVIIDDPELGTTALYNKNILNSTKLGMITGGASEVVDSSGSKLETVNYALANPENEPLAINTGNSISDAALQFGAVGMDARAKASDYVGLHVKEFESGNKGSKMISTGDGDHGGASFGTYQFPTNFEASTSLPDFWNKYYASRYPSVSPGNNQPFKNAWLSAVDLDPVQFFRNEYQFMLDRYWVPTTKKLSENGVGDPNVNRAIQEAVWSGAVLYGPETSANRFKDAGLKFSMDPKTIIENMYAYKIANVDKHFRSSDGEFRAGIVNRFEREAPKLLGLLNTKPVNPVTGAGVYPSATSDVTSVNADLNLTSMATPSQASGATGLGAIIDAAIKGIINSSTGSLKTLLFGIHGDPTSPSTDSEVAGNNNGMTSGNASFSGTRVSADAREANDFPYFKQSDPTWGNMSYGKGGTMASSACGPTSMAMVMRSYGINVDPVDTAQWSVANGHRVEGAGTDWEYFNAIGNVNGLTTHQYGHGGKGVPADASMISTTKEYLSRGIPVIGSMSPGTFTKGGHFIVFSGYKKGVTDPDGNILDDAVTVNDPSSEDRTSTIYEADFAMKQAKKFWAITGPGGVGSLGTGLNGITNKISNITPEKQQLASDMMMNQLNAPIQTPLGMAMIPTGGSSGIIDFTKDSSVRSRYSASQLSNIETKAGLQNISNKLKSIGGSSGVESGDIQIELLVQCVRYIKMVAENTQYNKKIADIVSIISNIVSIMGGKANTESSNTGNSVVVLENDLPKKSKYEQELDDDLASIMTQLQKLSSTA